MRNVKFVDLEAIIDFLYCGETNVFQQNLDSFLALAEDLQLKGLMGGQADNQQEIDNSSASRQIKREPKTLQSSKASHKSKENGLVGGPIATMTNNSVHELESTVKSMMTRTSRRFETQEPTPHVQG